MVPILDAPGADADENAPPGRPSVATAIPAFIGYTVKATRQVAGDLTLKPTRIHSLAEYERYFGGPDPETAIRVAITTVPGGSRTAKATLAETERSKHLMWYALRLYFDNGGGPCYLCSVADYRDLQRNDLEQGLIHVGEEDEPTLLVFPEAQNLAMDDFKALHDQALQQCAVLRNRFVIMDLHGGDESLNDEATDIARAVSNFRARGTPADHLEYGAAYAPNLVTNIPFSGAEDRTDIVVEATTLKLGAVKTSDGQLYVLARNAINQMPCRLPPAGAIAGVYTTVDRARGVWKAPANVPVTDAIGPTIAIDPGTQEILRIDPASGKSVNEIRNFPGRGTLVWGARTLAGNDNEWRYISVRRLCGFVEESIHCTTREFALEANDASTWTRVKATAEGFLDSLWRQGGLVGTKASDAFTVQVGVGHTMTADDVREGRMIVMVGLCPVRPAEFIVLRVVQAMPAPEDTHVPVMHPRIPPIRARRKWPRRVVEAIKRKPDPDKP